MILSDVSVKRPVFATVMAILLVAFGAISFTRLPLQELPRGQIAHARQVPLLAGESDLFAETLLFRLDVLNQTLELGPTPDHLLLFLAGPAAPSVLLPPVLSQALWRL